MSNQQGNPQERKADDLNGLRCPKCDYELTGLLQTKCPECGEIFDPAILRHPKPSRALSYIAHTICVYSTFNIIYHIILLLILESGSLIGKLTIRDVARVGLDISLVGGIVSVSIAFVAIGIATHQKNYSAIKTGVLAILITVASVMLALETLNYTK